MKGGSDGNGGGSFLVVQDVEGTLSRAGDGVRTWGDAQGSGREGIQGKESASRDALERFSGLVRR